MWQMMGKGESYRPPNSETTVTVNNIVGDLATVTIQAQAYKKLPGSGYCRTSSKSWHCWLNVDLNPLTQKGSIGLHRLVNVYGLHVWPPEDT